MGSLFWLVVGLVLGLLVAPRRGGETRRMLREQLGALQDEAAQSGSVKDTVQRASGLASQTVTRATRAAREAAKRAESESELPQLEGGAPSGA